MKIVRDVVEAHGAKDVGADGSPRHPTGQALPQLGGAEEIGGFTVLREVEAEALVPQAMADAFRSGNLGIMDYVRMKNVQADTSMRESIAGGDKPRTEGAT